MLLPACSSSPRATQQLERRFDVQWRERASGLDLEYRTTQIAFHRGRWSARISIRNRTGKPLYETDWTPPNSSGFTWNGPALVFNGLDVLGNRRLIYVVADSESPTLPYPLGPGATWSGTVGGPLPGKPALPRGEEIWLRYPTFGIGEPWDNVTTTSAVQWLSERSVEL